MTSNAQSPSPASAHSPAGSLPANAFAAALCSTEQSPDIRDADTLYDFLLGSWDVTVLDYLPDGTKKTSEGEWLFHRTLEGRAIQDVFIVPRRDLRSPATPKTNNRYGNTIRMYDEKEKKWRLYWFNPVTGAINALTAVRAGKDIIQTGTYDNGNPARWIFNDIKPDSFHWYAESSPDQGTTWKLDAEFFGVRR